jgi:hypothetical protein
MQTPQTGTQTKNSGNSPFSPVRADVDLPKLENEILAFWDRQKIFEKSLNHSEKAKPYSFYDGPPLRYWTPSLWSHPCGHTQRHCPPLLDDEGLSGPKTFRLGLPRPSR